MIVLPSIGVLQVSVYTLLLLGNSCVVSTSPLCMEFAVEKLYPVPEVRFKLSIVIYVNNIHLILIYNKQYTGNIFIYCTYIV